MPKRLLFAFLCVFFFEAQLLFSQSILSKEYTFACENCTPEVALVALSKQTGVNIAFSNKLFEACPPINVKADKQRLSVILETIVACAKVSYKVNDNQIVLNSRMAKYRIAGYVEDADSGERLIGAVVKTLPDGKIGVTTNEFGFFSIVLDEGDYLLQSTFIGYLATQSKVALSESISGLIFKLKANATLPETVILASNPAGDSNQVRENKTLLHLSRLKTVGMPGGEPDLLRLVALQTGVQTGVDGLGGLHVRGGNADQNLILLDDVPVYNPGHALGLLSIFNTSTINNVKFWKGNSPARYAGRASSVLDVRTRDGNFQSFQSKVSTGLFASSIDLEGPLIKGKTSVLGSARVTYFDPWLRFFSQKDNLLIIPQEKIKYRFFDINAKISHIFSQKDKIYLSFYNGGDVFDDTFGQSYQSPEAVYYDRYGLTSKWGNSIAAVRWNHLFGKNLFSNTTFTYSRFYYESLLQFSSVEKRDGKETPLLNIAQLYKTLIRDWTAKTDFNYYVNNTTAIRWGGTFTDHFFRPKALSIDLLLPGQTQDSLISLGLQKENRNAIEATLYAETECTLPWNIQLNAGLNVSFFQIEKAMYPALQPQIQLQKRIWKQWSASIGFHRMTQNLHQIGSFNISLPFELWVPTTKLVKPEIVEQTTLGIDWKNSAWSFQVEGYYKNLQRTLMFLSTNDAFYLGGQEDTNGWEERIAQGKGGSKGIEIALSKFKGNTQGSLGYTLSSSWRQFDDINSGRIFPFRYDRRHDIKVNLLQKVTAWLDFDCLWVYATGNPITLSGVKFQHHTPLNDAKRSVFFFTEVNGYRLPANHRLDVTLNFKAKSKNLQHNLQIGAYNIYNRKNPFFIYVDSSEGVKGKAIQYSLLPFMPILRYEIKF